jgi:hypothetical protein
MALTDDLRGPDIASLHPDPDVARRPGPEFRDNAGIMDADRTARALGLRREHVQAAVREQATREAQLGQWARQEAARQAAARSPELADAELDAEIDRLATAYLEPPTWTGPPPDRDASSTEVDTWERWAWAEGDGERAEVPQQLAEADQLSDLDLEREAAANARRQALSAQRERQIADEAESEAVDVLAPGPEPGIDGARWVPGQERDEVEVAGDLLTRHAAEAEDALRRERRATAYERFAQRLHDPELLSQARDMGRNARHDRQTATKNAYAAAASLQRSALGLESADTSGFHQDADPFPAERGWQAQGGVHVRQPPAQLEAG